MKNNNVVKSFIISSIGLLITALSINLLSWQFMLISGGLPGYALVINYLFKTPVGLFLFIINTFILILNFIIVGKTTGIKGVYGYIILSLMIEINKYLFNLKQFEINSFELNLLLTALQAIIMTFGIALVLINKYSLGNYSTILTIIEKYYKISAPSLFFLLDAILAIFTLFFFGWEKAILLLFNAIIAFFCLRFYLKIISEKNIFKSLNGRR